MTSNNNYNYQLPFEEYYRHRHPTNYRDDHGGGDEEQATSGGGGGGGIRPSLRMSESWLPSWVTSSDEDSSSLDTGGGSGLITPQLIYEQRRILLDIEERQQQQQQLQEQEQQPQEIYQPSVFGGASPHADRRFPINHRSSSGSITSMEEDKNVLNQSVHMFLAIDESSDSALVDDVTNLPSSSSSSCGGNSFEEELLYHHNNSMDPSVMYHHTNNMDPFRDEEEESYPHHRIVRFNPAHGHHHDDEDPANEITRSTHSARPIPIPAELLPPSHDHHVHQQQKQKQQQIAPAPPPHIPLPLEATLVAEDEPNNHQDVEALRNQMEQDLEQSKNVRKSLQQETERLRNRIIEMEEQEPKESWSRRSKSCGWIACLLIFVGVVIIANLMLYGGKAIPFFGKEKSTVTSPEDASSSSGSNVTMAPSSSLSPGSTPSLSPTSMAPTCQRPEMSTFFGGGSYRTKSGRLDGRYDVDCKREMSTTRMLIVLQLPQASCQVECVGYLMPSDYSRECHREILTNNNSTATATNSTTTAPTNSTTLPPTAAASAALLAPMGGGGGGGSGSQHSSPPPDVDFVLSGDYRNEILYLGYASSDFDLGCSQKLIMV